MEISAEYPDMFKHRINDVHQNNQLCICKFYSALGQVGLDSVVHQGKVEKKFSLLLVLDRVEKPFQFVLHFFYFETNQKGAVKNKERIKQRQMKVRFQNCVRNAARFKVTNNKGKTEGQDMQKNSPRSCSLNKRVHIKKVEIENEAMILCYILHHHLCLNSHIAFKPHLVTQLEDFALY
jgi:hypothetical protein